MKSYFKLCVNNDIGNTQHDTVRFGLVFHLSLENECTQDKKLERTAYSTSSTFVKMATSVFCLPHMNTPKIRVHLADCITSDIYSTFTQVWMAQLLQNVFD